VIALVGWLALLVAVASAATIAVRGIAIARIPERDARPLAAPVLGLLASSALAFVALEVAILSHDFSIAYVANNTATSTPLVFLFASGWAALEGSILLWGVVLAGFTYLVARKVGPADGLGAGALGVIGLVAVFWFGLMVTVANPFAICTDVALGRCVDSSWIPVGTAVAPLAGLGPNPLLQNHILMAVHPPMLYLGYVGLTVPFAFAVSALARGEQGRVWLDRTHRWSIIAWSFLTIGILLGGWWSYEVLGWGGYWAWDPVENAAFLPWLVATAFIHSAVVQRRRGMLQAWNFVLVIATFSLTILGTFLTRSGVIASVHSFTQSAVGPALLAFLGVVVVGSLGLFAMRAHVVSSSPRLESLASREGVFLANNLILTLFAFTVLVGTMYPLLIEALRGDQVSVGRPFFDRVTLPTAFALLLAMGVGPVTPYRVARPSVVWERISTPVNVGLVAGAAAVLVGVRSVPTVAVVVLAVFVIAVIGAHFLRQLAAVRAAGRRGRVLTILRREPGYWGGQIAHIGVALVAVGIAASTALAVRQEVRLDVGETAVVDDYCLGYEGTFVETEPNRRVEGAEFRLLRADCTTEIRTMRPRVNVYPNSLQPVATPDVRSGIVEDVYLSLTGVVGATVAVDVFVFPLMWMLWAGGLVTTAGGLWSVFARPRERERSAPPTVPDLVATGGSESGDA
jgi:cytochrome c-type biogenesis protein CcmF